MGGMAGGVRFVNAPLMASEIQGFKKDLGNLVEDLVGVLNQVDRFLGPGIYTWGELNSMLNILFCPEEVRMIRAASMRIWDRENRLGPPGDHKMPLVDPGWDPNHEEGRRNMKDYQSLIVRGIKESVLRGNNTKLTFDNNHKKTKQSKTKNQKENTPPTDLFILQWLHCKTLGDIVTLQKQCDKENFVTLQGLAKSRRTL